MVQLLSTRRGEDLNTVAQLTPRKGAGDPARKRGMPHERLTAVVQQLSETRQGVEHKSATRTTWDGAGNCQSPVTVELFARPSDPHRKYFRPKGSHLIVLELQVRCRKCDKCRKWRASLWTARAVTETRLAPRTWYCTLTLRAELQFRARTAARARLARQGLDFDGLPFGEQFLEHQIETGRLVTKWLKRLRKQSKSRFRYIIVAEHHKSGHPHYHALVHEMIGYPPIPKAVLEATWRDGFGQFRLVVDESVAPPAYVCKYLTKSSVARVRASGQYGQA